MKEGSEYQIDTLDRSILRELSTNARKPFLEIAKELGVAGGTIHQRVDKMKEAGIIKGYTTSIDETKLGYAVSCLIGVKLHSAHNYQKVLKGILDIDEVLEVHYTTGQYSMLVRAVAQSNQDLYLLLVKKFQAIPEIQSTETLFILDTPVSRGIRH